MASSGCELHAAHLNRMPSSVGYAELSTMDWDDIRFFLGVARAEQFSAAAMRMGVDTATVARRINALEKSLNTRLFDRRHTGCVLTEAGERFFQTAEDLESNILRAQADLSRSDVLVTGAVRIAAPDGFGTLFLCPRLAATQRDDGGTMPYRGATRPIFNTEPHSFDRAVHHFT
jgi:hypothetical protein